MQDAVSPADPFGDPLPIKSQVSQSVPQLDFALKKPEKETLDLDSMPIETLTEKNVPVERMSREDRTSKRNKVWMMCFQCNRPEGHHIHAKSRWFYSLAVGLTFGLILLVGPYQCQCCGSPRLMAHNKLNLKYWYRVFRDSRASAH
jgi:hypothetical protein